MAKVGELKIKWRPFVDKPGRDRFGSKIGSCNELMHRKLSNKPKTHQTLIREMEEDPEIKRELQKNRFARKDTRDFGDHLRDMIEKCYVEMVGSSYKLVDRPWKKRQGFFTKNPLRKYLDKKK